MGDKGVHTFFKGVSSKVIVIARWEFELAYIVVTVQYVSHYATETPLLGFRELIRNNIKFEISFLIKIDTFLHRNELFCILKLINY